MTAAIAFVDGGGGAGERVFNDPSADPGSPNTGGGGGGQQDSVANGGKGIVIIRYAGAQAAGGGTYSSSGGNSIHTFTGDGTFTANIIYQIN